MKFSSTILAIVLTPFFLCLWIHAQAQDELGLPAITNYYYKDYSAGATNWWIMEDNRGIMYFANGEGILEFDGETWRTIENPLGYGGARSLEMDDKGVIHVGFEGDLGYLGENEHGQLEYISLKDKIPEEHRDFSEVWETDFYKGKIYYRSTNRIFVWDGESFEVLYSESGYHVGSIVHDNYYLRIWDIGLCYLDQDTFKLVPGGEQFADIRIYQMLPYDDDKMLLVTRFDGLYLYDGQEFTRFKTSIEEELAGEAYLPGLAVGDGRFVINSFNNGVFIIDKQGKLLQRISVETGLQDNSVTYVYQDSRGILWLALFNGIASVALNSNITSFGPEFGLLGNAVWAMNRHQGILYVGSNNGIFYFDKSDNVFKKIKGSHGQTTDFMKINGHLLAVSGGMGLVELVGTEYKYIKESVNYDFRASFLIRSKVDSNRIYVGLAGGTPELASLYFDPQKDTWEMESRTTNIWPNYFGLEETRDGRIWTKGKQAGSVDVLTPRFINGKLDLESSPVKTYDQSDGLPDNIFMWTINDSLEFAKSNTTQFFKFNSQLDSFVPAESQFIGEFDTLANTTAYPVTDQYGRMWFSNGKSKTIGQKSSEGVQEISGDALLELRSTPIWYIYPEENNTLEKSITWFAGPDGLFRYEGNLEAPKIPNFEVLLRSIQVGGKDLKFGGAGQIPNGMNLSSNENTIKFQYAAPFYIERNDVSYQTILEGFEDNWSEPSKTTEKEYINLPKGQYNFKVRASNVYNSTSEEVVVPFHVLPPWYATWWAYVLYVLGGVGLIYLIVSQRTKNLRKNQQILEEKIKDRTKEVETRLHELATVNRVSRALTEKLELNELIQYIGDQMRDLFQASIAYLAIHNKETNVIDFVYQYGDEMEPLRYGEGLTSQIIKTKKPLLINQDISKSYDELGIARTGKNAASYLGVPIPVEDEVIGVLSVQSTEQENRFNENDRRLLNTIARNVGIAWHNAELYEEARQAKAYAEDANEAKSAFLSTVSHELRTPLTSVLGFAKIIRKRLEDKIFPAVQIDNQKTKKTMKQVSENLGVVISEGERLTNLINDVLDLAKIESGRMEWHMKPIFIQDVINRAVAATSSLFEEKNLQLSKQVTEQLPVINGDQDKLIQVVINLLSNAVKFTEKGKVQIEAYQDKDQIIVEVQDTGIGIAEEDKHKVFERFRQAGDTLTDKPQGTGLGLPICREIIEHHGGIIWMKSEYGVGSTFFFSIPTMGEGVTQPLPFERLVKSLKKQIGHSTILDTGSPRTILVVDDDTPIRSLLRQELTEAGYKVQEAANGKAALDMVRMQKPDLIILDVMMPEMNGFDVAAVLKNDPETMDIPIIILSIVQDKERGFRIGVDRYLTKPIQTDKLFDEIGSLLEQGVSKKKVMVVDEDQGTVKILSEVLKNRGYNVIEANGNNLLQLASDVRPDIVMLNTAHNGNKEMVKTLRFEKGLENVLFFIYE